MATLSSPSLSPLQLTQEDPEKPSPMPAGRPLQLGQPQVPSLSLRGRPQLVICPRGPVGEARWRAQQLGSAGISFPGPQVQPRLCTLSNPGPPVSGETVAK